jgi:hypothetical protein
LLRVSPVAVDDGVCCLLSTVALDERLEAETDGVGAGGGYAVAHERVDLSEQAIVHTRN